MTEKKYSVKEIAELAGVSSATVSRVINKNGGFSEETAKRVWEVINQVHFQPNQMARGLRTNRNNTIGLLIPDIRNEYYSQMALCFQMGLLQADYMCFIVNTNDDPAIEKRQLEALSRQKVSGLINMAWNTKSGTALKVPTVYIDRMPVLPDNKQRVVFVESDNFQGGALAACELIRKGASKPACISFKMRHFAHNDRLDGFSSYLREHDHYLPGDMVIVINDAVSIDLGYRATKDFLQRFPDTDGIFYTADILAVGGLKAAHELGRSIGEDLRIIGFDDITLSQMTIPSITTIHQNIDQLCAAASNALLSIINGAEVKRGYYKIPVGLITRQSC